MTIHCENCGAEVPDESVKSQDCRLVEVFDNQEEQSVFLAKTSLTDEQMEEIINNDDPTLEDKDYEERCEYLAEKEGAFFERLFTERVDV
jgi:uncharacterized Zn finger protein